MIKKSIITAIVFCVSLTAIAQKVYDVKKYGAKGDGKTNDAAAIQKAIDACSLTGGQVLIPAPFTFLAGPFNVKSNVELHIEGGAKILASPDEKLYTESAFRDNKGEGTIWIGGKNIENFTISGSGKIDGNGISFMGEELADSYVLKPFNILDPRPHVLTLIGGKNIRIKDVHIGNSAYWTVHLVGCNDVVISGITLLNSLKVRNSDGIDIDHSKNVRISDCYIESGDDCICLKNRREFEEFGACENITVTNCTMTSSSCAIKIGSENMDAIRQVVFNNCIIKNSNRGVGIQNRDEGTVSDVIFSNIIIEGRLTTDTWWGKAEPIYVTAYSRASGNHKDANWRFPKGATEGKVGTISNIYFTNIQCTGENGVYVSGETKDKIKNIVFEGVNVSIDKTSNFPGGIYDRRPSKVDGFIKGSTSGFYFDTAENIKVQNCSVTWGNNKPDYFKYAVESKNVAILKVTNLDGESAFPEKYEAVKKQ
ncbi:Glycosyl hydrolases family 28 [Flavobacterium resistens]|uniref:Glycoside hydrolase family 28 protein n=1 Tax=Flavobacterium resistens TaxID=443612 RepID=A0A521AQB0_9FLAO|nr:glycosyl hydrolase family 28 protein [Flavobacterium resistens]MRX69777.1 glycoside hydrolase family 28 protein [Flavobacterium resistens]SMO37009.1 Glycosyl hydrolases family 28 [Flavobacterium resistens]